MTDRIVFVGTLVLAGIYFWATEQIPSLDLGDPLGPRAFPRMLGVCLLIAAAMLLAEMLRNPKSATVAAGAPPRWDRQHWVIVAITAWTALYIFLFEPLGYLLATAIYLLGMTCYFNRGRWLMNVLTSVLFVVISYFLFTQVLGVTLARGILPI